MPMASRTRDPVDVQIAPSSRSLLGQPEELPFSLAPFAQLQGNLMHKRRAMSEAWTGGGVVTDARTDVCFGGKVSRPPLVGNGSHLRRECYPRHLAEGQGPEGRRPCTRYGQLSRH